MKNIYLIILLFMSLAVVAQENTPKPYHLMVMGVPQRLLKNAVSVELDLARKQPNKWLVLSPTVYYRDVMNDNNAVILNDDRNLKSLFGAGLEVFDRRYITHKKPGQGFYISWGGGYRFLNIKVEDYLWKPFPENDLTYFKRENDQYSVNMHGLTAKAFLGVQYELAQGLLLDVFVGAGIRASIYDRPEGSFIKFNQNQMDYGYTGTFFVGGVRLGVGF